MTPPLTNSVELDSLSLEIDLFVCFSKFHDKEPCKKSSLSILNYKLFYPFLMHDFLPVHTYALYLNT
jgi:hypothetical protein